MVWLYNRNHTHKHVAVRNTHTHTHRLWWKLHERGSDLTHECSRPIRVELLSSELCDWLIYLWDVISGSGNLFIMCLVLYIFVCLVMKSVCECYKNLFLPRNKDIKQVIVTFNLTILPKYFGGKTDVNFWGKIRDIRYTFWEFVRIAKYILWDINSEC